MNQKEFHAAMLRGLGRCVIAAKQNPERYRKSILTACTKNTAYDPQCEGSRSWYTYTLAACFADRKPFIDAAANALKSPRLNRYRDPGYLAELLMLFASSGDPSARQAVEDTYQKVLGKMFSRTRRPESVFYELFELEELGIALSVDCTSFLRIAEDFGCLYREKSFLKDGDFWNFYGLKGKEYRKALKSAAGKNKSIARFLQREQAYIRMLEEKPKPPKWPAPEKLTGIQLALWMKKEADRETVEQYALAYREENDPKRRAKALSAFARCPYPDDPQPIIQDAQSDYEELSEAAWTALEHLRHPSVRAFALNNMENKLRATEVFSLLVVNYMPEDGPILEKLLREKIARGNQEELHSAGLCVNDTFSQGRGIPRPRHLLPLLYQHTPCPCCRESFVRHMARHRMLTTEILEECQDDSYEKIRRYAKNALKRIRAKQA